MEQNFQNVYSDLSCLEKQKSSRATDNRKIYPQKPSGKFYNWRTYVSYILLLIFFALPFIKVNGQQAVLLNFFERKFVFFGSVFWPQDLFVLLLAFIIFIVIVILFTVLYGRIWCGWACPQTIFLEMVFRKIEFLIEGSHVQQKILDNQNRNFKKIIKKLSKHSIFIFLSFLIANLFLAYIISSERLFEIISQPPAANITGFLAVVIFSSLFYFVFAFFREQACTVVCPYGRLQDVLLDNDSIVISYDFKRGEKRAKLKRERELTLGDCIDCRQCVSVCPTGIDIRNGTQLECINCAACIDACDNVMEKIKKPLGLIRHASVNQIAINKPFKWTSRVIAYTTVLVLLIISFSWLMANRPALDATVLRVPGSAYTVLENNKVQNIFQLKILNKSVENKKIEISLSEPEYAELIIGGNYIEAGKESVTESIFYVILPIEKFKTTPMLPIKIDVFANKKFIKTIETNFRGPQGITQNK